MAKTVNNTHIYLDCYNLLNNVIDISNKLPREYKYSIGRTMIEDSLKLVNSFILSYNENITENKKTHICNFISYFEELKLLFRISGERKWLPNKNKYADIIILLEDIYKQVSGYKKSLDIK